MSGLRNLKRIGPEFYGCHSVVNHDHDYHANDVIIFGSCSGAETMATAAKAPTIVFPALRDFHLEVMSDIEEWCGLGVSSSSLDAMIFVGKKRSNPKKAEKTEEEEETSNCSGLTFLQWLWISSCRNLTCLPKGLLR
ncbi:hypothetical protein HYC85_019865 [Camellia sinensis]|uniref:Uncharacterized protein n=1 Tax=Camellia sinensis TaxID=4442 RepID=A0A7J7GN65_CAMSI|nr:hypothetical protein HYC85_019865 [Camellia sinensis]